MSFEFVFEGSEFEFLFLGCTYLGDMCLNAVFAINNKGSVLREMGDGVIVKLV